MSSSRVILCLIMTGGSFPCRTSIRGNSLSPFSIDFSPRLIATDNDVSTLRPMFYVYARSTFPTFDFRLPNIGPSLRLVTRYRQGGPVSASHLVSCGTPASSWMQSSTILSSPTFYLLYPYALPSCINIPDSSGMYLCKRRWG